MPSLPRPARAVAVGADEPQGDRAARLPREARPAGTPHAPTAATLAAVYVGTRALCLGALAWGGHRVARGGSLGASIITGAWHWDVHWYVGISLQGYEFTKATASNVAFFPATPTVMSWMTHIVGHPI